MPLKIKHIIAFFWIVFISIGNAHTQSFVDRKIKTLLQQKAVGVPQHPYAKDTNILYWPMFFSSSYFQDDIDFKIPNNQEIVSVHLVYTRYRQVDTFNQPKLNEKRFYRLAEKHPRWFKNEDIEWRIFEQTKAKTEKRARKMFHGFIVFLKENKDPSFVEREFEILDDIIGKIKDTIETIPDKTTWRVKRKYFETGRYLPWRKDLLQKGVRYSSAGIWFRKPEMRVEIDSIPRRTIPGYSKPSGLYKGESLRSLDVYNSLIRHSFRRKWAIVTDVTGSMSPFTGQVLAFIKNHPYHTDSTNYSFFNDGNGAPELIKRIGISGGVYTVKNKSFDSIYSTVKKAMNAGDGGDLPENNIEAILRTIKKWPDTDTVLMIADEMAPVKDMALLKYVEKPVVTLICSHFNTGKIPKQYVQIARVTHGGILTEYGMLYIPKNIRNGGFIDCKEARFYYRDGELSYSKR